MKTVRDLSLLIHLGFSAFSVTNIVPKEIQVKLGELFHTVYTGLYTVYKVGQMFCMFTEPMQKHTYTYTLSLCYQCSNLVKQNVHCPSRF